jgi:hypothetical protein
VLYFLTQKNIMNLTVPKNYMLLFKKFKLTLDPCETGLLRATFHIQFIVLFEPFNLMYRSLKSDFK